MAVSLLHQYQSAIADSGDTDVVQPSNWNAEHTLSMATNKLLGRGTAGTGAVEEITLGTGLSLSGTTLNASGGAPGGSDTYVQFNDGGSTFGGDSGLTFDKTNNALTVGGATVTTSNPVLNLSQTWNAGAVTFTGLKLNVTNTTSAAASLLMDLQVGGTSKFMVGRGGNFGGPDLFFEYTQDGFSGSNGNFGTKLNGASTYRAVIGANGIGVTSQNPIGWSSSQTDVLSSPDLYLWRDAANTLALRNSTSAQTFNVYNTYTDASNYERGIINWSATSNVLTIGAAAAGTGTRRNVNIAYGTFCTFIQGIGGAKAFSISDSQNGVVAYSTWGYKWTNGDSESTADTGLNRNAAGVVEINNGSLGTLRDLTLRNIVGQVGYTEMAEMTAPAAPAANSVRIYAVDNGAGKTQLMALFGSGAAQQIAIEP